MNHLAPALFLLFAAETTSFDALKAAVEKAGPKGDALVRRWVRQAGGTPLVEGNTAILVVAGDPQSPPRVLGDWNGWGEGEEGAEASRMERLGATSFFYEAVELRPDARVEYLVAHGEREAPDPLNPRRVAAFSSATHSEIAMPEFRPVVGPGRDGPHGRIVPVEHASAALGTMHRVDVYLPPGYDEEPGRRYPEAWLGDGAIYVDRIGGPAVLDALIAEGRLEPLVAVFVDTADRRREYSLEPAFRRMMADELVPRIAREFRVEARAERRLVAGGSRGGQAMFDLCLARPDVFGLCGAWAPAIRPRSVADFIAGRQVTSRFTLVHALYDETFGPDSVSLRDALRARYLASAQGHTMGAFGDLMARLLVDVFPAAP
jgi:hypothetical protein